MTGTVSVGGGSEGGVGAAPRFGQGATALGVGGCHYQWGGSLGEGGGPGEPKRKQAGTAELEGGRAEVSVSLDTAQAARGGAWLSQRTRLLTHSRPGSIRGIRDTREASGQGGRD